jgi:inorganic pyrophosphatase
MRIDAVPVGSDPPQDINVIVEVPIGGEPVKYEMDKASGTLFVDRMLYTAMRYPGNYGFVPHTLSADGDPVDVLIANQRPLIPGCVINCRPVGVLLMSDEKGGDEKIIAVPSGKVTARYSRVMSYRDLPDSLVRQIAHFFEHYKDLEDGKWVRIERWGDAEEAREMIRQAMAHPAARAAAGQ